MYLRILFIFCLFINIGFSSNGLKYEESFKKDNFVVKNALIDDVRYFRGQGIEVMHASIEKVLVEVLDFSGRCNQKYVKRR